MCQPHGHRAENKAHKVPNLIELGDTEELVRRMLAVIKPTHGLSDFTRQKFVHCCPGLQLAAG